jgi:SAM-dependent methyltransferase
MDPFATFKAVQREAWGTFAPLATFTTLAASSLVEFADVRAEDSVLDVACGTGVVAVTAGGRGARVCGLDLSPVLLERAARNAELAGLRIEFREGDVEALPYQGSSFDVVLSQFGHMFAPRPQQAIGEMLRVLKPGGRIAFSTWPPDLLIGRMFTLVSQYNPAPPGVAPPTQWGKPDIVRERLGGAVRDLRLTHDDMLVPALSPQHFRASMESTAGPILKVLERLESDPERLARFRGELDALFSEFFFRNRVQQTFLMTRAIKR